MSKNRGYQVQLLILCSLFVATGVLIGYNLNGTFIVAKIGEIEEATERNSYEYEAGKVEEMLRYVENQYVEEIDREELIEKTIDRCLKKLDTDSNYISAKQLHIINKNLESNLVARRHRLL